MLRKRAGICMIAVLGTVIALSGCAPGGSRQVVVELDTQGEASATDPEIHMEIVEAGLTAEYYLEVGDKIRVDFFFTPELSAELLVRPDGRITMPAVGEMMAARRTPRDLAAEIESRFSDILLDPAVTVIVKDMAAPKVYVIGMVERPGPVDFRSSLSAMTAISAAGGAKLEGKLASVIVLRKLSTQRVSVARLDLSKLLAGADPSQDMYLKPYDIVFVPKRFVSQLRDFAVDLIKTVVPAVNMYRGRWIY
ncbi:MAG: polysaccharide biosynthesis/export family protein [Candidatus Eisenbacteria sp.]|nr:polysaccharide biosynthesis/export family protein [Candidatus Eisenbacteria bacterium]